MNKKILALLLLVAADTAIAQSTKYPAGGGGGGGSVSSVTAGTGLSGGTITTTGTIALTSPVTVAHGGTNATSAGAALTSLGAAASGANADITSMTKIGQSGVLFNDAQGSPNFVEIVAPGTVGTSYDLILPTTGTGLVASQPLCSTGTGAALTWCSALTNLVSNSTLATKLSDNVAAKNPAFYYCEANVTLNGSQTCDGQSSAGAVLVANQTDNTTNGLYTTNDFGAWALDPSWDSNNCDGMLVTVGTGGTSYSDTLWQAVCPAGGSGSGVTFKQVPTPTRSGTCTVASTTISTTAANETCTGVPASTAIAVTCSGAAAFSTATANGLYCRATGTLNQIACNTTLANTTAMAFNCMWMKP